MFTIEKLYHEYKTDVYQYLLHLTRDSALSEDLLSDTFVCAIKSLPSYRGSSSIKTWLFGIARNRWLQNLRHTGREQSEIEEVITSRYISLSIEDHILRKELIERVQSLLKEKDEKAQKVVAMRIHGYSYCEIASELAITENSARVIDFRTKNWIRMKLEQEGLIYERQ